MKTSRYLLFYFILLSAPAFALGFQKEARLYDHLCEVNAGWRDVEPAGALLEYVHFASDRARIQKHLELVEVALRSKDVSELSDYQRARRLHHLENLRAYRQEGVFPTNHYHTYRRPYFRDNYGVLCAVGYLIWQDGQQEIVERVNAENNYGYIAELAAQYPEIDAWAQANGFTRKELAWIQPSYDPVKPDLQLWGNGGGLSDGGRINVMVKNQTETKLFVAGQFTSIDGVPANSIVAWNGTTWSVLGNGVTGEIFAMEYEKGWNYEKLYVAGDFFLPGQPDKQNIAVFDLLTGTWKGLQSGDMQGSIFALEMNLGTLFVGGDFQQVNGVASPFTAAYNPTFNSWTQWSNPFSTDGPVRDFELVDNLLLVGGEFKKVYQGNDSAWIDAPHLAYYSYWGEWLTLAHDLPPVQTVAYHYGNLFVGHELSDMGNPNGQTVGVHVLKAGLWFEDVCFPFGDNTVHGFLPLNDALIAYGGFASGWMFSGTGASSFFQDGVSSVGYLLADNTVRSIMIFKEHVYIAGDFQFLFGDAYPGLARIYSPSVPVVEPDKKIPVKITVTSDHLALRYDLLEQKTQLTVYDLQGRLMAEQILTPGDTETTIDAAGNWTNGLYVWHLQNASGARSGKWPVMR